MSNTPFCYETKTSMYTIFQTHTLNKVNVTFSSLLKFKLFFSKLQQQQKNMVIFGNAKSSFLNPKSI